MRWYRSAAERGHPGAQFNLGAAYANGEGVTRDYAEAVTWLRKAAEQGHPDAQVNLGIAYQNGRGVPRDPLQAYYWFSLAAERSAGKARDSLAVAKDRADRALSPAQRLEARRMIGEWKAKHPGR